GGTRGVPAGELRARHAGIDRGRYAGPVGWIDAHGDGEWALALRCGQLTGPNELRLFAGVGIVADSDAADEFAETAAKFVPMRDALGDG
ncbi:MAG: chorismate-binding protein, partial [Propionibacteriaceae bacterium]|nr:chorismate-binding protein [Propionibacteriaceae bacterium]